MTEVPDREDPAVPSHGALFDDPLAPTPDAVATPAVPSEPSWVPQPDEPVAVRPGPAVDTGRLFRSAGAEGPTAAVAIPALTDEQAPVVAGEQAADAAGNGEAAPVVPAVDTPVPAAAALAAAGAAAAMSPASPAPPAGGPAAAGAVDPGASAVPSTPPSADVLASPGSSGPDADDDVPGTGAGAAPTPAYRGGAGLTWTGVTVVEIGVTVLLAFADVLVTKNIGIITGVALVLVSVYCALVVRPADLWAAVVTPPIAYLAALLTAGLLTYTGGGFLARTGLGVFTDLALNAPWIVAATGLSLIIVLVRRARARRAGVLPAR